MRRPAHVPAEQERRHDRLDDLGLAIDALGRTIARGDRLAIETACWTIARRLTAAAIEGDDAEEISATVGLIEARVRFGVHERLRRFLLPLAAAVQRQVEEAESDL